MYIHVYIYTYTYVCIAVLQYRHIHVYKLHMHTTHKSHLPSGPRLSLWHCSSYFNWIEILKSPAGTLKLNSCLPFGWWPKRSFLRVMGHITIAMPIFASKLQRPRQSWHESISFLFRCRYYLDAALMFARALRLDPNIQSQLDICCLVRRPFWWEMGGLLAWRFPVLLLSWCLILIIILKWYTKHAKEISSQPHVFCFSVLASWILLGMQIQHTWQKFSMASPPRLHSQISESPSGGSSGLSLCQMA